MFFELFRSVGGNCLVVMQRHIMFSDGASRQSHKLGLRIISLKKQGINHAIESKCRFPSCFYDVYVDSSAS